MEVLQPPDSPRNVKGFAILLRNTGGATHGNTRQHRGSILYTAATRPRKRLAALTFSRLLAWLLASTFGNANDALHRGIGAPFAPQQSQHPTGHLFVGATHRRNDVAGSGFGDQARIPVTERAVAQGMSRAYAGTLGGQSLNHLFLPRRHREVLCFRHQPIIDRRASVPPLRLRYRRVGRCRQVIERLRTAVCPPCPVRSSSSHLWAGTHTVARARRHTP